MGNCLRSSKGSSNNEPSLSDRSIGARGPPFKTDLVSNFISFLSHVIYVKFSYLSCIRYLVIFLYVPIPTSYHVDPSVDHSAMWSQYHKDHSLTESQTPLEFVFQEQSYSSFHSGRSLGWDHIHRR